MHSLMATILLRRARRISRPFSTSTSTSTASFTSTSTASSSSTSTSTASSSSTSAATSSSTEALSLDDPSSLYQYLRTSATTPTPSSSNAVGNHDSVVLHRVLESFSKSRWASTQSLSLYLPRSLFPTAASQFRSFLLRRPFPPHLLHRLSSSPSPDHLLFPLFAMFCRNDFPRNVLSYFRSLVHSGGFTTSPHLWFPFARAMRRRVIYHCGPTNSGKTYNALQRFIAASSGLYCGPLRLLAMEIFDKVNSLGVYCSLVTGQEKKSVPFATHVSCTVEMASVVDSYEVAVVDEIQMAADRTRGHAWTRALLGLRADEIHLCGDPSVLPVVRRICRSMGDDLVEHRYSRFKPLVVEARTLLSDLSNVRSGDCIVAFSRREIFEVKLIIEKSTTHRCCVIYGGLPPETRRQQADLFNAEDNTFDVLVASDAVGMGLNLNIRRIIFYSLSKYDGRDMVPISASQVKQIAGRAGRRSCRYPDGLVTTLNIEDLNYLIECLKSPTEEAREIGLFPFFEHIELFAAQYPNLTFPSLLDKLFECCNLDRDYFLCHVNHMRKVAQMLEKVPDLSLQDRFNFCFAPVNVRDPKAMYHLLTFASRYAQKLRVNIALGLPKESAKNDSELLDLETKHQVLSTYLWLSRQFGADMFPFRETAEEMATNVVQLLGQSLANVCWKPESRNWKSGHQQRKDGENKAQKEAEINNPDIVKAYDAFRPRNGASNAAMPASSIAKLFQK